MVADAYAGPTAIFNSSTEVRPDPISCCTSAASPYAAGGAAALIQQARRILGDRTTGVHDGVLASGCPRDIKGPLGDGVFTLDELKDVLFHTAEAFPAEGKHDGDIHWAGDPRPPDNAEYGPGGNPFCVGCTTTPVPWSTIPSNADGAAYQFVGYGAINERSVAAGIAVLKGKRRCPTVP